MRVRIEIEWAGQPWRALKTVRLIALIDVVFGLLLAIMYVHKLAFPDEEPTFNEYTTTHQRQVDLKLACVFLIAVNLIQTIHAFRLYSITIQRNHREPAECYGRARRWFDYSEFVYLFSVVKSLAAFAYLCSVALHCWVFLMVVISIPEICFKMWAFYRVNGFMADLKQSLKFMPRFKFIPVTSGEVYNEEQLLPSSISISDKEFLLETDLNANIQQLV